MFVAAFFAPFVTLLSAMTPIITLAWRGRREMIRSLGLAAISLQLLSTNAIAVCGPGLVNTIFHAAAPETVSATSVLEVTILRAMDMNGASEFAAVAKVDRVIKGPSISGDMITIITPYDDCFLRARPGDRGIVVGDIEFGDKGDPRLSAIPERVWKTRKRDGQRR